MAVPLRAGGKKMRKRKELDALGRRGRRAPSGGGVSSQDGLLSDTTDDEEWRGSGKARLGRGETRGGWARRRACVGVLRACTLVLVFACVVATTTVMWLFIDVREQATFLRNQLDQGNDTGYSLNCNFQCMLFLYGRLLWFYFSYRIFQDIILTWYIFME